MSPEISRTISEQSSFELELVRDLEKSFYATNNWRNKEAPEIYATRFIDAMIRIQCGDIKTVTMDYKIDPAGQELVLLLLPRWSYRPDWDMTIEHRVKTLEKYEPEIRDLLPAEN